MISDVDVKHSNIKFKLQRLYILVSIYSNLTEQSETLNNLNIEQSDIEAYFKSNIILQYGILGYVGFPFKVVQFDNVNNSFIIETNNDCLTKLQLIISNQFPALCPVDFSSNILNSKLEYKFKILKFNNTLSSLIHDDFVLNTS
ncbi:hypothetical protein TpMuguga_02g02445 [Theileria parva strain Muguga]|uniref:uncharacterized protein n=1 Tax=Theileria parva strain Muguga TaxID=333668 RepID=UPI001C61CC8D|nr:uncharacterized protein TpMuguga_02g02445 [Theileria parva strain Muguga]KAF5153616.1 hypothetical protein TpMuguga_02g02445 [Theileria parva strain Muguga]